MTRIRIIGTVEAAIEIEESLLGRKLPPSFRNWLLENNTLGIGDTYIYPVRDERDTRKTWNSLSYNLQNEWAEGLTNLNKEDYSHLLPFADSGVTDYFCFDYSADEKDGEYPVILWSRNAGKTDFFAENFNEFVHKVLESSR